MLVLAACGPLPRPMQHDPKLDYNPLLRLPDSQGVVIRPVDELPPGEPEALARALATALHEANIPASTQTGNAESLLLDGRVIAAAGRLREVAFTLREPDGKPIGGYQLMVAFPAGPLVKPEDWADPAASVAAAVARMMQPRELAAGPPARTPPAGPAAPGPEAAASVPTTTTSAAAAPTWRMRIKEVRGVPAERTRPVARAVEHHLRRAKLALADASTPPDQTVGIAGEITLGAPAGAQRRVSIRWTVSDAGGRQLGTIDQANDIPTEMVERAWGEVAAAIGEGAAAGIADVVERTLSAPPRADALPPARTFTGR